jgi:glycosyltransferase involved in cell wall biosynthesis
MTTKKSIICCTPFTDKNWKWLIKFLHSDSLEWHFFYSIPQGWVESRINQPNLAMIRTCQEAVNAIKTKNASLLFTHDPKVSFWCAFFCFFLKVEIEHIAYAFNFPDLPTGLKRYLMTRAFEKIDKFIVYSSWEKQLYHDYFDIPLEKIDTHLWSVGKPTFQPNHPLESPDYICAIGGNARDYSTLIKAMEKLPQIRLVLVARPNNLHNLDIPANVNVLVNITKDHAMNILNYSRFMVLPLRDSQVPCGHVTLVAAMHLGKAFIITDSIGISDYAINDYNCLTCIPSDSDNLVELISLLWNSPEKCNVLGKNGLKFALENCSEQSAAQSLDNILREKISL